MSDAKQTMDHDTIRQWVEARDGYPARVHETAEWDDVGVLRIEFRDPGDTLEKLDWDAFFEAFEADRLAFLYQEKTEGGETSRFCKFVDRD